MPGIFAVSSFFGAIARGLEIADQHGAFAVRERQSRRLGQAGFDARADHDAIHHRVDLMVLARRQVADLIDVQHFAIDAHAHEAGLAHRGEDFLVLALAAADQGGHHDQFRALRQPNRSEMICSAGCWRIVAPHCGQAGSPSRANSSRR